MFGFRLPMDYNPQSRVVSQHVLEDLELIESKTEDSSLYQELVSPTNVLETRMMHGMAKQYTTNISFLKDTQKLLQSFVNQSKATYDYQTVVDLWSHVRPQLKKEKEQQQPLKKGEEQQPIKKEDNGFHDKYQYVGWSFAKHLNDSASFLQCLNLYSIVSPLISLALPLLVLIVPFFILKFKQLDITFADYMAILSSLVANHAMVKVFTQFGQVDTSQKVYLLVSAGLYLFSLYQNMLGCIRVYTNMKTIHAHLTTFRHYIRHTLRQMDDLKAKCNNYLSYRAFTTDMRLPYETLQQMVGELETLESTFSVRRSIWQMGGMMQQLYQFHQRDSYACAMEYSFQLNGYVGIMHQLSDKIGQHKLTKAVFVKRQKKPVMKQMVYPKFINQQQGQQQGQEKQEKQGKQENLIVSNSCNLSKYNHLILTGANASGKTTVLKTIMINVLYSQQFGYGCFAKCKLHPFDYFHCYLNIPDTSNRDSLFQSEARRCKEIIDCIQSTTHKTHLCILDELYSGTNVEEAVVSGCAFMRWMSKQPHVCTILTTHFTDMCVKLQNNNKNNNKNNKDKPLITNMQMVSTINPTTGSLNHSYQMIKGISTVKGGIDVLHQLEYPQELLDECIIYYG